MAKRHRSRFRLPKGEPTTRALKRETKRRRGYGMAGRSVFLLRDLLRRPRTKRIPRRGREFR